MDAANLRLSEGEIKLVTDASWILTKNSIMDRAVATLAALSETYKPHWNEAVTRMPWAPDALRASSPKISRGEQCEGLPWAILDYPRLFGKEDAFAVRTLFWWGKEWQLILYVRGEYMGVVGESWSRLRGGWCVSLPISGGEWAHGMENYREIRFPADTVSQETDTVPEGDWCKIAIPIPLDQWNEVPVLMEEYFKELLELLSVRPDDTTNMNRLANR